MHGYGGGNEIVSAAGFCDGAGACRDFEDGESFHRTDLVGLNGGAAQTVEGGVLKLAGFQSGRFGFYLCTTSTTKRITVAFDTDG